MGPQAKQIGDWLEEHQFRCPGCGNDSFALGGTILLPNVTGSVAAGEPQMTPVITVKCTHCAYISFFDPGVMGLSLG